MYTGTLVGLLVALILAVGCAAPASSPAAPAGAAAPAPASGAASRAAPAAAPSAAAAAPPAPVHIRVASQFASTDVGHFVAIDRGYYQQEGLDVELVNFSNASEMIPALATDQVEAGGIGGNPAMWNAVARGVRFKFVLDKSTTWPGTGNTALVVRKEVWDGGRGRRLDDLKGLRIAFTPPGKATTNAMPMDVGMQRV